MPEVNILRLIPDRHIILDDSHETKKRKKTAAAAAAKHPRHLEETMSVGFGGLLRRLSKRDRDVRAGHHMRRHPMVSPYFVNLSFAAVFWNFFDMNSISI